jgi:hypothetical protein
MSRYARRLGPAAGGLLLFLGLLTGCGNSNNNSSPTPGTTPAPAVTNASPAGGSTAACADLDQIKKSSDDLQSAVGKGDLTGAQNAYRSLTDAVKDLGTNAKAQGSAAAKSLHDIVQQIIGSGSDMNTLAKLGAIAVALKAAGPAISNTINTAKQNLTCPS